MVASSRNSHSSFILRNNVTPRASIQTNAFEKQQQNDGNKSRRYQKKILTKWLLVSGAVLWVVGTLQTPSLESTISDNKNKKDGSLFRRFLQTISSPSEVTNALIDSLPLGWSTNDEYVSAPEYLKHICPEVLHHYTRFPSFQYIDPQATHYTSLLSTQDAVHLVCTLKVTKALLASLFDTRLYLDEKAWIGAKQHGQPLPWDDRLNVIVDHRVVNDFHDICKGEDGYRLNAGDGEDDVRLHCDMDRKKMNAWLSVNSKNKKKSGAAKVEIKFYDIIDHQLVIVTHPEGSPYKPTRRYDVIDYFPTIPWYFAGIYVLGAQKQLYSNENLFEINGYHAIDKYDNNNNEENFYKCATSRWNNKVGKKSAMGPTEIDCEMLKKRFPFLATNTLAEKPMDTIEYNVPGQNIVMETINSNNRPDLISNGPYVQELFPSSNVAAASSPEQQLEMTVSVEERDEWSERIFNSPKESETLGEVLIHKRKFNLVSLDNSISPFPTCNNKNLKVVEVNLHHGRWWLEAATTLSPLKEADVIIVHHMDDGMARSDNQHTALLMAHLLKMNYMFGVEYMELTNGNAQDVYNANGMHDFRGLVGNAIFSKCHILKPVLFRNPVERMVNVETGERRIGGNMALMGRIQVADFDEETGGGKEGGGGEKEVVVGSIDDLKDPYGIEIRHYVGSSPAIVAGRFEREYCQVVDMNPIGSDYRVKKDNGQEKNIGIIEQLGQQLLRGSGSSGEEEEEEMVGPSSCEASSEMRTENMCANNKIKTEKEIVTIKPCISEFELNLQVSSHAFISTTVDVNVYAGGGEGD